MVIDLKPIELGLLKMVPAEFSATYNCRPVLLQNKTFKLAYYLASRPGQFSSRNQLLDFVWGQGVFVEDRSVDTMIKRVRKAFVAADPNFNRIHTIYGVGYCWRK